ncbi:spore coat protein YsxE [Ferdinandcohnia quinoae]|uniref:spore coat protein YsxE n=1 Tax=Fredinandcohnia quinoae TaxID=2918902 RepID=UPI001F070403|nr:spore coat protein YsxE [Fredinandcohnia sp. SECRCQ15]
MKQYKLEPHFIEEYRNVKKVFTNKGVFALKSARKISNTQFPSMIQMLYQKGFTRVVPIIPTIDGSYLVFQENQYHYLMPWLNNSIVDERDDRHHLLFKELAKMHQYSLNEIQQAKTNDIYHHYENITKQWDERDGYLESFVIESEKKWYMSPFELLFCTYYHEISLASKYARSQLDKWYELSEETKSFRTVLTNGKVSITHFLFDEHGKGYLSNFEKASYASPINDLISFYYRTLKTFPILCDDCFGWFQTYRSHFPLKEEEIYLFLSYLTYPEPIYRCVQNYKNKKEKKSEQEYVRLLQKAYWLNKNIEYFSMKIVEEEQRKKDQEAAESHTE